MYKLFIGGFPLDMDEMGLAQMVGPFGDIGTLKIVRDKKTRICKGYAFIEMTSREGAEQATEALDGLEMGDRKLRVSIREEVATVPDTTARQVNYRKVERSAAEPLRKKRPRK